MTVRVRSGPSAQYLDGLFITVAPSTNKKTEDDFNTAVQHLAEFRELNTTIALSNNKTVEISTSGSDIIGR